MANNDIQIQITERKTGKTETIFLSTDKDTTGPFVVAGIPIVETTDDSLDTLTFIVRESPTRKLYRPFDIVTVSVRSGNSESVYRMCVLDDNARMLSRRNRNYEHTVTCVEMTKILEKIKIFNLNLTNPHDTLLDQLNKALNNADPAINVTDDFGEGRYEHLNRFFITKKAYDLLLDKKGEDFRFGNTDLRSVLDSIFSKINCRVSVSEIKFENENIWSIGIDCRSMTATREAAPVWDRAHHGEIVGEEFSVHGQDVAGKIVSRGYNTLVDEPITFTSTFKTPEMQLTDENASIMLPFPISQKGIKKLGIYTTFRVHAWIGDGVSGYSEIDPVTVCVDIASRLIPLDQYNLLDEETKKQYIPFEYNSTILPVGRYVNSYIGYSNLAIKEIVRELGPAQWDTRLREQYRQNGHDYYRISIFDPDVFPNYYNHVFSISYFPQIDSADVITKPNIYDPDDVLLGLQDNQSENTLDMERHGRRLQSLIKRTGNDEYYLDVQADSFATLLPLTAKINLPADGEGYTDSDYVLYKRECAIYSGFVNCRYYFSKNYNAVQEAAGVRREKHLYDIPLESDECPIVIKRYMVFGFEKGQADYAIHHNSFIKSALSTLTCKNEGRKMGYAAEAEMSSGKINFMVLRTLAAAGRDGYYNGHYYEYGPFLLPCATYGKANTMNFVARTLDNYSVDYKRDGYVFSIWGDAGNVMTYSRYVSNEEGTAGECSYFDLQLAFDCGFLGSVRDEEKINKLPYIDDFYYLAQATTNYISVFYQKDRTQRPLFCHIVECVPCPADYGRIMIGSAFCRDNNLVRDNESGLQGLKLVVSRSVTIDDDDSILPAGFSEEYAVTDYFEAAVEEDDVWSAAAKLDYKGGLESGIKAWAIVNSQGEIYLAANGMPRTVYAWMTDIPK